MAWNKTFPTSSTKISQSVTQIQDNWNYIETTLKKDHYFASTPASNDGHHKYVHLPTSGDQAVILTGVIYQKTSAIGLSPILMYRNASSGIQQIPTSFSGTTVMPAGAGTSNLTSFAGMKPFMGTLVAYGTVSGNDACSASVYWSGANARANQTAVSGLVTSIQRSGTNVTVTKTAGALTLRWAVSKVEY